MKGLSVVFGCKKEAVYASVLNASCTKLETLFSRFRAAFITDSIYRFCCALADLGVVREHFDLVFLLI